MKLLFRICSNVAGGFVAQGLALCLLVFFLVLPVAAGVPEAGDIPLDDRGLPLWEIAAWNDFPVRLELSGSAELARLLAEVPLASFSREQITPQVGGGLIFEPRVTATEAVALEDAGFRFTRLPDLAKESRRAAEEAWTRQGLKTGLDLKREAAGYYPTHAQIGSLLAQLVLDYPDLCRTFSWGLSVEGREMWGLVISADVQNSAPEPEVRLSSTMHGDEPVGMVMLLNLADYLAANYGNTGYEDVTNLVDNYEIHLLPLHNPDGYVAGIRSNHNGIDLNRNFDEPAGTHPSVETENLRFMDHSLAQHFVVSGNFHGGALVVNYPWDYQFALTPDDAAIIQLSLEYSTYNLPMYNNPEFPPQGIINGAVWYVTTGCLQDWSYFATDCIDVTIELSNLKWPPASQLDGLWDDNRESLLHFIKAARYGVNGVVTDAGTGLPLDAAVTVVGNAKQVSTDPAHGDYYKLLDTGTYDLVFEADGYTTQTITGVATVWGTPTVLDVALVSDLSETPVPQATVARLTASPNPFNPRTTISVINPGAGRVTLDVFDLQGRRIRRLHDGWLAAGQTEVVWDGATEGGDPAASGIYFAQMSSGDQRAWAKMVLVK